MKIYKEPLLNFYGDGNIRVVETSYEMLKGAGYDPCEHGNSFCDGKLYIR